MPLEGRRELSTKTWMFMNSFWWYFSDSRSPLTSYSGISGWLLCRQPPSAPAAPGGSGALRAASPGLSCWVFWEGFLPAMEAPQGQGRREESEAGQIPWLSAPSSFDAVSWGQLWPPQLQLQQGPPPPGPVPITSPRSPQAYKWKRLPSVVSFWATCLWTLTSSVF